MEFKLQNIQTALFIEDINNINIFNFPSEEKFTFFLDGQPFFTNVPIDAPKDIPRLILQSKNGLYKCNISFSRVDLFQGGKDLSLEDHNKKTISFIDYFIEKGASINRIGFIGTFLSEGFDESNSANYIRRSFIKDELLKDPKELNIGYNKRRVENNIEFNHVINFWGGDKKELRLQIDVNNVPTTKKEKDELIFILEYSLKKIENIKECFPDINI
ncbi:MAG: hypothetical protein XE08_0141 [Parcubacteria bacterium 32_520]|jgi:hypothetical protein|nr:MAG: hypothetical protein XE08_0141 [Parcubacteria bacterium 32_520]